MTLRAAREQDRALIVELLDAESLPTSDLETQSLENFLVAEGRESIEGCVGVEILGDCALLRSLVVNGNTRGKGLAGSLVAALEKRLPNLGVAHIWLLTIDADGFFARHGYRARSRDEAPDQVRRTKEFSDLCPGSAILMHKSLDHS